MKHSDFYEELGVSHDASQQEIKAAYINLAKKFHPDKNASSPEYAERMCMLNQAYSILSNPRERMKYDILIEVTGKVNPSSRNAKNQKETLEEKVERMIRKGREVANGIQNSEAAPKIYEAVSYVIKFSASLVRKYKQPEEPLKGKKVDRKA